MEKCPVFVLELREVSDLNDKSVYECQPSLNVILKWMKMRTVPETNKYVSFKQLHTCSIKIIVNAEKDFVTQAVLFKTCILFNEVLKGSMCLKL